MDFKRTGLPRTKCTNCPSKSKYTTRVKLFGKIHFLCPQCLTIAKKLAKEVLDEKQETTKSAQVEQPKAEG